MKTILRLLAFSVGALLVTFLAHRGLYTLHHYARTKDDPRAIYLIGDSRSVHGLDLERLSERLERPVYSHSTHGASPYSFWALAETVPAGATAFLVPSHGMLVRDKEKVAYDSALSLSALARMAEEGYELWYFEQILLENRFPLGAPFSKVNREPYEIREEVVKLRQRFDEIYQAKTAPWHYRPNQRLFLHAVEILLAKGCDVRILEMPVHPELAALVQGSIYRGLFPDFPELERLAGPKIYRDVVLPQTPGQNLWYDLDHLNVRGRERMTEWALVHVFEQAPTLTPTGTSTTPVQTRTATPTPGSPSGP